VRPSPGSLTKSPAAATAYNPTSVYSILIILGRFAFAMVADKRTYSQSLVRLLGFSYQVGLFKACVVSSVTAIYSLLCLLTVIKVY